MGKRGDLPAGASADELAAELLTAYHPGQRVSVETLRLLFSRRRWNTSIEAVRQVHALLSGGTEALDQLLRSSTTAARLIRGSDGNVYMRRLRPEEKGTAVLDVSNLVWSFNASGPKVEPLLHIIHCLRRHHVAEIVAVADANLQYVVADPGNIAFLSDRVEEFRYAPAGTPADPTIIEVARERGGWIGSNDQFREWRKRSGWARSNLWRILVPIVFVPPDSCDLGIVGDELQG